MNRIRTASVVISAFVLAAPALVAQTITKFSIPASAVTASTYDTANNAVPANAVDGNLSTRWAGQGDGAFITFDLGPSQTVSYVKIAWYQGNTRTENFEIRTSSDGLAFTTVWSGNSSGTTTNFETYDFTDVTTRYVRIVGHGNSSGNGWNSVSELEVWGIVGSSGGGATGTVPFTVEAQTVGYNSSYWSLVSDAAASGGSALKELVNSTSSAPGAGGLVYTFTLASSSTVYLQIKAKAANTSSDSVWARLDSGSWSQFTFDSTNQYTWRYKSYSSVSAGTHTFELRCREQNGLVDLVAVTLTNGTPPPVGTNNVAAPSFSPGGGTYTSAQNVTISTSTSGATIRYTTNGTTPTSSVGTVYSAPVSISVTSTLKAIAYKSGMTDSPVTSATYTITASPPPQVAAPTFNPVAGTYSGTQNVTISTATSGATIRYTTNGTTPSQTNGTVYSGPVVVSTTTTLKAIAYAAGMTDSAVSTASYTITTNGLDPNAPPGDNFDLSHWKITLPINNAEEHSAAELVAGYENPDFFFTDPDTGGMVFKAPNLGDTTGGSTYARSELREMLNPTGSATAHNNNWVTSTSSSTARSAAGGVDGTMNATLTVDHVSTTGDSTKWGRVIVGQIHGPDSEVIRLYYHKRPTDTRGAIYFGHDTPSNSNSYIAIIGDPNNLNPANGILLGQMWSYEIKVVGHTMTVKVTPQGGSTTTVTFTIESGYDGLDLYFKAGVYNQNNTGTSSDYAQATFYSLTHVHP
jgi:poly(beta-D-mannuronate) lyase